MAGNSVKIHQLDAPSTGLFLASVILLEIGYHQRLISQLGTKSAQLSYQPNQTYIRAVSLILTRDEVSSAAYQPIGDSKHTKFSAALLSAKTDFYKGLEVLKSR